MIKVFAAAILGLWLFTTNGALAQSVFDDAVDAWLQGDDQKSLPVLADLAREGHNKARVLLARIESMDRGPSPYRLSLSSPERRALFRDTSGPSRFGRSWLAVEAAEGNRLAEMFLRSRKPVAQLQTHFALWQAGERQATDYPTRIVALYGSSSARNGLASSEMMLPELKPYLAYLIDDPEPRGDGLAALRHMLGLTAEKVRADDPDTLGMAGFLALGFGFGDMSAENAWRGPIEDWLLRAPEARPIADLCRAECPRAPRACAVAFMALSGGYYEIVRLDSPYEAVIPQEMFLNSPRARLMTVRRAALARDEPNQKWLADGPGISRISACAADLVLDARAQYDD